MSDISVYKEDLVTLGENYGSAAELVGNLKITLEAQNTNLSSFVGLDECVNHLTYTAGRFSELGRKDGDTLVEIAEKWYVYDADLAKALQQE